jgi:hypothetical protein
MKDGKHKSKQSLKEVIEIAYSMNVGGVSRNKKEQLLNLI